MSEQQQRLAAEAMRAAINLLEHSRSDGYALSLEGGKVEGYWLIVARRDQLEGLIPGRRIRSGQRH